MNKLVQSLTEGDHPVTVGGSQPSLQDFQKRVQDMEYVLIKFPETQGGTDLGIRIDKNASDFSQADFEKGTGVAHVEGTLILDYVKVCCVADIELETLYGTGHLVVLEEVYP
jgi:hypothetical protein